ncbi:hypothetical protein AGLY_005788 [Aphis glycines]|uniref:Uncharacterized protein n=1 Tax=Aphis glycines TaxID=307491 RepID=A0A6G0TU74_APHGL|nr:hypothetical protein AGLY_005788 [Aphis glycines]
MEEQNKIFFDRRYMSVLILQLYVYKTRKSLAILSRFNSLSTYRGPNNGILISMFILGKTNMEAYTKSSYYLLRTFLRRMQGTAAENNDGCARAINMIYNNIYMITCTYDMPVSVLFGINPGECNGETMFINIKRRLTLMMSSISGTCPFSSCTLPLACGASSSAIVQMRLDFVKTTYAMDSRAQRTYSNHRIRPTIRRRRTIRRPTASPIDEPQTAYGGGESQKHLPERSSLAPGAQNIDFNYKIMKMKHICLNVLILGVISKMLISFFYFK